MAGNIYVAYWSNIAPVGTLLIIYASIISLWLLFRFNPEKPATRLKASFGIVVLSSVSWAFIGVSLLFCWLYAADYESYVKGVITRVFGYSLLSSIMASIPLAIGLRMWAPQLILNRFRLSRNQSLRLLGKLVYLSQKMGVHDAELVLSDLKGAICLTVEGAKKQVVVSSQLEALLNDEELEAVLAHELSHIKSGDSRLKLLAAVYRCILPFDPIVRLAEAALHRESELRADDMAVQTTAKPLALASALLKMHESGIPRLPSFVSSMLIGGRYVRGALRMSPPLKQRIERLIKMAENLQSRHVGIIG